MSSEQSLTAFSGLLGSIREGLDKYLTESSDRGRVLGESSALFQVSSASLKNVAYSFFEEGYSPLQMLATRITFLEAGVMSLASTATNLFFALFYTALCVATLGIAFSLRTRCKIHWMHVAYGAVATAISACGVLSPYYGIGLNGYLLVNEIRAFKLCYQKDISRSERLLVEYVQQMAKDHWHVVRPFIKAKTEDLGKYEDQIRPSLDYIETKISHAARMEDLTKLASDIFYQWPKVGTDHT
ncbi:MAG: hypothetical protein P0S96_05520 [Simkaniaceae bacterium]|nr:hypothetical protein [Candidatus Sacchlamyda saccharinae]